MLILLQDAAILVFAHMTFFFFLGLILRDNGIVDVGWGLGFTAVAWLLYLRYPYSWGLLPTLLVTIWGLRLALHIGYRNSRKKKEDWRYARWRREWGRWVVLRSFLQVYMLQGFFMLVIALPLMQRPATENLRWFQYLGIALFLTGFLWEAVSDWQLLRFKQDPHNRGRLMTSGLWRLSRHPNYFGEAVLWWGIWLLCAPNGLWWISLISPVVLTYLLLNVSGVSMLEEKYEGNAEFREYARHTPAFVPDLRKWFRGER